MSERVPVQIPKVSMAVTEAVFIEWLVEDGAKVEAGESIYSVETEKVTVDVEAATGGVLRHGVAEADEVYPVGTEIGHIESSA
jgi:pyruvate/2-oxoglutarate dehydrogenase complex dihydrolipoamide acyltransferase (E2) component